ncbi:alanine/glycine:cation symporter family protein [Caldimonas thermodepolymerans]|jgi:AGCS family alanine or glycine:cation symporter|uniref:AGCS family alanine or glycine:cation symporter n=1 Tax=Caldimonas thermodepolymerans TaxID=215580 RepID=A0AA46DF68_9BURK|nr:alanine/glycine:cation symporter family protein [Caldimonas thermodepolymerans]TCP07723.1 AGCS family alanine or glycine:cation symporter [Caldimonas thermodepolymerans]UZG44222.1 alanine:cation symporter family protein [Caldimonas thermodepolymerans]UZG47888.1 alanine:cation symporter family protein [Caldimonas thermodepolymerans]
MSFAEIVSALNGVIWSPVLVYLCLGVGLYFSLRTRFMQVRGFGHMLHLMFKGKASEAGVSSFQALAMSLSGRVGTGNIAGVATAITFGGPGAVFWMWMVAFLGASTAYVESTLAQIYKEKDDQGLYRGGPAYYIEKCMGQKWYAWIFAVATVIATGLLLPGVQANSIASGLENAWGIDTRVTAAIIVILLGFIIFGGVKRIAKFAEIVVPFMALAYILVALVIVLLNITQLPAMVALIFRSAFGLEAAFGAVLGLAVEWGVKRGVYSNEAGQGTGPHPAAAAEVQHPAQQGFVQAFSIYVDTLLVCSATAFMLLSTGMYNVTGPDGAALYGGLPGVETGPRYTQAAVESVMPGFGAPFVALALFFFAFTTIVAYYYMAETNIAYINRKVHRPWLSFVLKLGIMAAVTYGAVRSATVAWDLGDMGVGLMAWLNIIAIIIIQKPALLALNDYERQKKAGLAPAFDPEKLGIRNAHFWVERLRADREARRQGE